MFPSLHINPGREAEATGMNAIIRQFEMVDSLGSLHCRVSTEPMSRYSSAAVTHCLDLSQTVELKSSQGQSNIIYSYLQPNQQSTEGIHRPCETRGRSSQKSGCLGTHQGHPLAPSPSMPPPMYLPSRTCTFPTTGITEWHISAKSLGFSLPSHWVFGFSSRSC